MSTHSVLDVAAFRALFLQFASELVYPNLALNAQYAAAGNYISQEDSLYGGMTGDALSYALQLLTCHLLVLSEKAAGGQPAGFLTSGSEGDVSISMAPPPMTSGWRAWLAMTTYGMQLWGLLASQAIRVCGAFGGTPERAAFRRGGGRIG